MNPKSLKKDITKHILKPFSNILHNNEVKSGPGNEGPRQNDNNKSVNGSLLFINRSI